MHEACPGKHHRCMGRMWLESDGMSSLTLLVVEAFGWKWPAHATIAAAVEFAVLHAATIALVSGQNPSCSNFDLSRWGLLNLVAAPQGSSSMPADSEMRDRSRSPQPKGCSKSSKPKGSDKEPKGSGKGQSHHGRSGLEPSVIKLLRAWYAKDWGTVGSTCDSIYWSRKNIRDQVG